jgi:hypothetical protein
MVVVSYCVLLALWAAPENMKFREEQALANFEAFLASILPGNSRIAPLLPEDLAEMIKDASTLFAAFPRRPVADSNNALCELVFRITDDVCDVMTPILERLAPYDGVTVSCARVGLLAAAAATSHLYQQLGEAGEQASVLVADAIRVLTAMQGRSEGNILANEILILVRA